MTKSISAVGFELEQKQSDMIEKKLEVIDLSASVLCYDNKLNLRLFSLKEKDALKKAIQGKNVGTLIYS